MTDMTSIYTKQYTYKINGIKKRKPQTGIIQ